MTAGWQSRTEPGVTLSLYDQLGQESGISTAVDQFYARVLADPALAPYFQGIDLDRLRKHQVALLSTVSGGPQSYSGRTLQLAHRRLGVTDEAFDKVVGHLSDTLDALGAAPDVRDQVTAVLGAERGNIVTQPATV